MKLKLEKRPSEDCYKIVRVRHANKRWEEKVAIGSFSGTQIMYSYRPSPEADVEGDSYEMEQLAIAINCKGKYSAKRCEIEYRYRSFILGSPKNSWKPVILSIEDAEFLRANILNTLGETK